MFDRSPHHMTALEILGGILGAAALLYLFCVAVTGAGG